MYAETGAERLSTFNNDTHKFETKYLNIIILEGPQESIDALKEELTKFTARFTFATEWKEKVWEEGDDS